MKYLAQFAIISAVTLCGEALHFLLPLPIPAGIYGMVVMLAALLTGVIKPAQVRDAAVFLIEIMPVMFVPITSGVVTLWDVIRPQVVPFAVICLATTVMVMAFTGRLTQFLMGLTRKEGRS